MAEEPEDGASKVYLTIGDVVLLSGVEHNGFIGSWQLTSYESNADSQLALEEVSRENAGEPLMTTYGSLFEVTQMFACEAQEEERRLQERAKRELGHVPAAQEESDDEAEDEQESDGDIERSLQKARKRAQRERMRNERELTDRRGEHVTYGGAMQLRHVETGSFVTLYSEASKKEHGALSIGLTDRVSSLAHLRFLPAYGGDARQGRVCYGDAVVVQSAVMPEMSAWIGGRWQEGEDVLALLGSSSHVGTRRLAASKGGSAIRVVPWRSADEGWQKDQARRDEEMRIVHGETGLCLSADASGEVRFAPLEECGQSLSSLWKVERHGLQWAGQLLWLTEEVRLRHLLTGKYLGDHSGEAVLSDEGQNWQLLSFRSSGEHREPAILGSRLHLRPSKNTATLSALQEQSRGAQEGSTRVPARLVQPPMDRDGIMLKAEGRGMAGTIATLKMAKAALQGFTKSVEGAANPAAVIQARSGPTELHANELRQATGKAGTAVRQVAREVGAVKATFKALKSLNSSLSGRLQGKQRAAVKRVGSSLHAAALQLCREDEENKKVAAEFLETMCGQLGRGIGAGKTLVAILRDNKQLLTSFDENRLRSFVKNVRELQSPDAVHLDFLAELCGTSEEPIAGNQAFLWKALFSQFTEETQHQAKGSTQRESTQPEAEEEDQAQGHAAGHDDEGQKSGEQRQEARPAKALLVPMWWDEDKNTMLVGHDGMKVSRFVGSERDRELGTYADWLNETDEGDTGVDSFRYACAQLSLLRSLCQGSNVWVAESVVEQSEAIGAEFRTLLTCAASENVPKVMRATALDLIFSLHLQPPLLSPIIPKTIRVPPGTDKELTAHEQSVFGCRLAISEDDAVDLADVLISLFQKNNGKLTKWHEGTSALVASAMAGCLQILRGGPTKLATTLRKNSVASWALALADGRKEPASYERFHDLPEALSRAKQTALAVAEHDEAINLDERCSWFLDEFFQRGSEGEFKTVAQQIDASLVEKGGFASDVQGTALDCMRYEVKAFAGSGLKVWMTHAFAKEHFLDAAARTIALRKTSELSLLEKILKTMRQACESLARVGGDPEKGKEDPTGECKRAFEYTASLLRPGATVDGNTVRRVDASKAQQIMARIGFIRLLSNVLTLPLKTQDGDGSETFRRPFSQRRCDLLASACRCLELVVDGNVENGDMALPARERVFSLLNVEVVGPWAAGAYTALLRCTPGAAKAHGKAAVRRLYRLAMASETNQQNRHFLDAIARLCVNHDKPLEPIQAEVAELMMENEQVGLSLLRGKEGRTRCDELLEAVGPSGQRSELPSELEHHLASVRLLRAACTGGTSVASTMKVANVISYNEAGRWILRLWDKSAPVGALRLARAIYLEYIGDVFFNARMSDIFRFVCSSVWPIFPETGPSTKKESTNSIDPTESIIDLVTSECRDVAKKGFNVSADGGLSALEFVSRAAAVFDKYFTNVYEQNRMQLTGEPVAHIASLKEALDDVLEQSKPTEEEDGSDGFMDLIEPIAQLRCNLPVEESEQAEELLKHFNNNTRERSGEDELRVACRHVAKELSVEVEESKPSGKHLEVKDLNTTKHFAHEFSTEDSGEHVPGSEPAQQWRSVVKHACRLVALRGPTRWKDLHLEETARCVRAALHFDALQENRICESEREVRANAAMERLQWAQKKYAGLGAAALALRLASENRARGEGLKLGNDLLVGKNAVVQRCFKREFDRMKREGKDVEAAGIFGVVDSLMYEVGQYIKLAHSSGESAMLEAEECRLALRFLHLLCEGTESPFKLSLPASLLNGIVEFLGRHTSEDVMLMLVRAETGTAFVDCLVQCVEAAAEMVIGPTFENKEAFVLRENVLVVLNQLLLACHVSPSCDRGELLNTLRVRISVLSFLLSLLEGRKMANEVVERFYDALDVSSIGNDMEASLKMLRELDDETLKGLLDQQLSTSSALLLRLADMRVKESAKASHFEDVFGVRLSDNISSWIEKQMRVVEVDIGDSDPYLERVDFRLPPECYKLAEDAHWRKKAQNHVRDIPRGDVNEKAKKLQRRLEELDTEIGIDRRIRSSSSVVTGFLLSTMNVYAMSPFYVSVVATLLAIIFYGEERDDFQDESGAYTVFGILSALQVLLTLVFLYLFLLREAPLWVATRYRGSEMESRIHSLLESLGLARDNAEKDRQKEATCGKHGHKSLWADIHSLPPLEKPPQEGSSDQAVDRLPCVLWIKTFFAVLYVAAAVLAFLGFIDVVGAKAEFFIAIHVLIFFTAFDAGRTVLDAVILVWPRLLRNGIIGILAAMMFGLIAFAQFRNDVLQEDLPCNTLYECVGQSIVQGWLFFDVGGILGGAVPDKIQNDRVAQVRIFLRFIYWAAWNVVVFNIFIALLLDAYGTIRSKKIKREEDEQDYCLVCSLPKDHFEDSFGHDAFSRHRNYEHRPLNYVFFLRHLDKKSGDMYSGTEYKVQQKRRRGHLWLPEENANPRVDDA